MRFYHLSGTGLKSLCVLFSTYKTLCVGAVNIITIIIIIQCRQPAMVDEKFQIQHFVSKISQNILLQEKILFLFSKP
jgi:hypothetical protein